ncbi:MAG: hypothetical protein NW201_10585 [Gemmatimonadales bacterium]|nr:hypothetical protein [Gemmatimonadales bacterium]
MSQLRAATAATLVLAAAVAGCQEIPLAGTEPEAATLPAYTVRQLGLLAGGASSEARAVNADGRVVGVATDAGGAVRAVYFDNGAAVRLAELAGATASEAWDINDAGVIVGVVVVGGDELPVRWASPTAQPVLLPLPAGVDEGVARSVNNAGVVVGNVGDDEVFVLWSAGNQLIQADPASNEEYEVVALNGAGQVIGNAETDDDEEAGFRWSATEGFAWLGSLEGGGDDDDDDDDAGGPSGESEARGLNPDGVVVGHSEIPSGRIRAFRWSEARRMVRLGEPPAPDTEVSAAAVNAAGLVAGHSFTVDAGGNTLTSRPVVTFMLEAERAWVALAGLGGARAEPADDGINACGVVVGWAQPPSATARRAVAWVPGSCTVR